MKEREKIFFELSAFMPPDGNFPILHEGFQQGWKQCRAACVEAAVDELNNLIREGIENGHVACSWNDIIQRMKSRLQSVGEAEATVKE